MTPNTTRAQRPVHQSNLIGRGQEQNPCAAADIDTSLGLRGSVSPDLTQPGVRDDGGKMKWHLLPVPALLALCKVFHGGAIKYADDQWRGGLKFSRIYRSMISHFMKWLASNSSYDKELGTHHLMMVAWGCFVLYMYEVVYGFDHLDDRKEKGMLTDDDFEFIHTLIENKLDRHATQKEADRWWENEMAPTSKTN